MKFNAKWIQPKNDLGDICPIFMKDWTNNKKIVKAQLFITALGVYEAKLNDKRISDYVLAPGWTVYNKRLQYQQYDITEFIENKNTFTVTVGKGWFRSPMPGWLESEDKIRRKNKSCGLIAEIHLTYFDGDSEIIRSDDTWLCGESKVRFSEIYDGESYDSTFETSKWENAVEFEYSKDILIPQEGEIICEMERIAAKSIITTPSGETVIDFGQEVTGYVEFTLKANKGDKITLLHGEVLDKNGNFYNENYRSAKAEINYICKDGVQIWHPTLTFFGFRYIKLAEFPIEAKPEIFTAVVVYSDIKRTGYINTSNPDLNQLISNIFWGQKGNFLDVPTDCPQRDERLGWTGDAQVFVKAASYNYNVEKFFKKWLNDLSSDQREDGAIGQVIPDYSPEGNPSAAWGDAATICPWQIYLTYGNKGILKNQFSSMKKWVGYITNVTNDEFLWTGGEHFGDWLGLDAPQGSYKGSSREDFIASAFYAYSVSLVIKAGNVLGVNIVEYDELYKNIINKFRKVFTDYRTQTEHILAVRFNLAEDMQKTADSLAEMVRKDGLQIKTGFVGTPYILHVLSDYGYTDLAYTLLLRQEYPSWIYSVRKGATTIWEHWDGIMDNGDFWSKDMNSFNHYAYGAVADWLYEVAGGIRPIEEYAGFERVVIEPKPDKRLEWFEASIDTKYGKISSKWIYNNGLVKYEITTPVPALIKINKKVHDVKAGVYTYFE